MIGCAFSPKCCCPYLSNTCKLILLRTLALRTACASKELNVLPWVPNGFQYEKTEIFLIMS
jgi:hypothetical protein